MKFAEYYKQWIELNKAGSITLDTLKKYYITQQCLQHIAPNLLVKDITRAQLQIIFNEYAKDHHKTTVGDFINHVYASVIDAYDEGLIARLPVRKFINNGHDKKRTKSKFLSQKELSLLLAALNLGEEISWEYFILLLAKTGLRFAEALALKKEDINLEKRILTVNKSLEYKHGLQNKNEPVFKKTKTSTSNRLVVLDWHFVIAFQDVLNTLEDGDLIFGNLITQGGKIHNSTVNDVLERACKKAQIPIISAHSLRHTHASILIAEGVSMLSVSKRLGHANTEVTQRVYVHLTQELEDKDTQMVVKALSGIF